MGLLLLLLKIGIAGALGTALWKWRDARVRLRGTTLMSAWRWALVAGSAWLCTWCLTASGDTAHADQLWYLTAVLMLCPPLAVLGAKQPMSRVWTPFVILPLFFALGWSALASAWEQRAGPHAWALEEPVIVGYALVLLMTAGNHVTTRFAGPVLLWTVSLVLIVLPVSPLAPGLLLSIKSELRGAASLLLAGGVFWLLALLRQPWAGATPLDRLWREFHDLFGVAWARRIQDRMNDLAVQHAWPVRLQPEGFAPAETAQPTEPSSPESALSPEQALRWLLRRFVDEAWIDRRLKEENSD